jgi:hypothetical protein
MSTTTTIQAHIAYGVIADQNPGIAVSDLRNASYAVKSASDEVEADNATKAALPSSENGGTVAPALTLDDFGGKSDALGG